MSTDPKVRVYGLNHIAIEVTDVKKAVDFYSDVFNLEKKMKGRATHSSSLVSTNSWRFLKSRRCSPTGCGILGSSSKTSNRSPTCERK